MLELVLCKRCSKCGEMKPVEGFYARRGGDGFREKCRECFRLYYKANRDEILSGRKEYYQANRARRLAYQNEYNRVNRGVILPKRRARYAARGTRN